MSTQPFTSPRRDVAGTMAAAQQPAHATPPQTPPLAVAVTSLGASWVVSVTGELDAATAPLLREAIDGLTERPLHLVLDFDNVTFMDSSGINALVAAHRRTSSSGGSLRLVCHSRQCLKVLQVSGLSQVFRVCDTVADAVHQHLPEPT